MTNFYASRQKADRTQQPTDFRLDTYTLQTVFDTPELITSLAHYSQGRQPDHIDLAAEQPGITKQPPNTKQKREELQSTLFLQIFAAADYYTMNNTLMEHVPPVFVDIILDPYLFNVFPRSLVPTTVYIVLLAFVSWYLSRHIRSWFQRFAQYSVNPAKKDA